VAIYANGWIALQASDKWLCQIGWDSHKAGSPDPQRREPRFPGKLPGPQLAKGIIPTLLA